MSGRINIVNALDNLIEWPPMAIDLSPVLPRQVTLCPAEECGQLRQSLQEKCGLLSCSIHL